MKYLSILSLMMAFTAFSTGASAEKFTVDVSEGCEAPTCQAAFGDLRNQCHLNINVSKKGKHVNIDSNCTPDEFKAAAERMGAACPSCKIDVRAE